MSAKRIKKPDIISEWYDETTAAHRRFCLGLAGSLVSWELQEDGRWLARLSGPGVEGTVEAYGKSRVDSIKAAEGVFALMATATRQKVPVPSSF